MARKPDTFYGKETDAALRRIDRWFLGLIVTAVVAAACALLFT